MDFKNKYLKYKNKYVNYKNVILKLQIGGGDEDLDKPIIIQIREEIKKLNDLEKQDDISRVVVNDIPNLRMLVNTNVKDILMTKLDGEFILMTTLDREFNLLKNELNIAESLKVNIEKSKNQALRFIKNNAPNNTLTKSDIKNQTMNKGMAIQVTELNNKLLKLNEDLLKKKENVDLKLIDIKKCFNIIMTELNKLKL